MCWQINTKRWLFPLLLLAAWLILPLRAPAQSEIPNDLVNAVNDLRASHGLEPYRIDSWLMAYAQEHSEYQAEIQSGTHIHSDGTLPQDIGLQENVASGNAGVMTVAVVVYEGWVSDWGHRHVMLGYSTGEIGAGIALSENGQVYYTIDIRPGESAETTPNEDIPPAPFVPLQTSTPSESGSIIHTVHNGETLWSIAQSYGVTVDDIRRWNGMAADNTLIFIGQKLLIKSASTATPILSEETSPTLTQTHDDLPAQITGTVAPTATVLPSPSSTALPSPSDTVTPADIPADLSPKSLSIVPVIVIAIGIFGLLIAALLGLRKSNESK